MCFCREQVNVMTVLGWRSNLKCKWCGFFKHQTQEGNKSVEIVRVPAADNKTPWQIAVRPCIV